MLNPNMQYVVRWWDNIRGETNTVILFKDDIERLKTRHFADDIRVWELETNDLKKVEL